jgi:dTDP-L-rhamnose 4-epimerase
VRPLVLVTGGAGFIGSHIVDLLLEAGYPVRVYDSLVEQVHDGSSPRHLASDAEFVRGDMRDASSLRRALEGVEIVVHDAAEVGVGQSMYEMVRYVGANTLGTAVLLEAVTGKGSRVGKLVVASSMSIYGEGAYSCAEHGFVYPSLRSDIHLADRDWEIRCPVCDATITALATDEGKPLRPTSIYAISKMDQELMCLVTGTAYDLPVVALRYFNTYGPGQALSNPYTGVAAIFSSRLLNGKPPLVFEDGLQSRDLIHVQDIARANLLAIETNDADGQAVNVGTGRPTSVLEVAQALANAMDVDIEPQVVGEFRSGDIRHCWADPTRARDFLGFEAEIAFEAGVADLVEWAAGQQAVDRVEHALQELTQRGLAR